MKTFLYLHCVDLAEGRRFYTSALGLTEIYFSAPEQSVGYQVGSVQISIGRHPEAHAAGGWSKQLGWHGGTSASPSWGLEFETVPFRRAIAELHAQNFEVWRPEPDWVGYWSFPVKDPMGNTVEVSAVDPDAWPPAA